MSSAGSKWLDSPSGKRGEPLNAAMIHNVKADFPHPPYWGHLKLSSKLAGVGHHQTQKQTAVGLASAVILWHYLIVIR